MLLLFGFYVKDFGLCRVFTWYTNNLVCKFGEIWFYFKIFFTFIMLVYFYCLFFVVNLQDFCLENCLVVYYYLWNFDRLVNLCACLFFSDYQ